MNPRYKKSPPRVVSAGTGETQGGRFNSAELYPPESLEAIELDAVRATAEALSDEACLLGKLWSDPGPAYDAIVAAGLTHNRYFALAEHRAIFNILMHHIARAGGVDPAPVDPAILRVVLAELGYELTPSGLNAILGAGCGYVGVDEIARRITEEHYPRRVRVARLWRLLRDLVRPASKPKHAPASSGRLERLWPRLSFHAASDHPQRPALIDEHAIARLKGGD